MTRPLQVMVSSRRGAVGWEHAATTKEVTTKAAKVRARRDMSGAPEGRGFLGQELHA